VRRATLWTWNVNGLDEQRLDERTEAACFTVLLRPDPPSVLLLQEVVRRTWHAHWRPHLQAAGYSVFPEDPTRGASEYFSIVAAQSELGTGNPRVEPFAGSEMGRALVSVEVGGWLVCTAHLESGKAASAERVAQLAQVCARLQAFAGPAVFGGDTNLRVEEEPRVEGLPALTDAWAAVGAPPAKRATWLGGRLGARFDRVLCTDRLRVCSFSRLAAAPLPDLGLLSDHAAVVVELEVADG
jgi:endonuclease/exonuclease/phosphatase family metal-dependent hydrolase